VNRAPSAMAQTASGHGLTSPRDSTSRVRGASVAEALVQIPRAIQPVQPMRPGCRFGLMRCLDEAQRILVCAWRGALATPVSSVAQQPPKVWRIGYLSPRVRMDSLPYERAFLQGMSELGYVEGKMWSSSGASRTGHTSACPTSRRIWCGLNVDVIVAPSSSAIRAAQQATKTTPIVFISTGDPVGSGFVASLAQPGGNITGLSNTKLGRQRQTLGVAGNDGAQVVRVAVLGNPGSSTHSAILKNVRAAALTRAGVRVLSVEARHSGGDRAQFRRMTQERADSVIVAADAFLNQQAQYIAPLALKRRLPSISQPRVYVEAGGLMSYGQNTRRQLPARCDLRGQDTQGC